MNAKFLTLEDGTVLKSVGLLADRISLWDLAESRGASREDLERALGPPHYVERDSTRTHGGEEDTWRYAFASGALFFVEYRVPYLHAAVVSNTPEVTSELGQALSLIPGKVLVYSPSYQRS